MGVNIIENWCRISGRVTGLVPSSGLEGFSIVEIEVAQVRKVGAYPCFYQDQVGALLPVYVPEDLIQSIPLTVGIAIRCWLRKGGLDRNFLHRDRINVISTAELSAGEEGGQPDPLPKFTLRELQQFDGDRRPEIYIAFRGVVYDVTDCRKWSNGLHEGLHFPGQDLTTEIEDAPHFEEVFQHPCIKIVGELIEPDR